MGNNEIEKAVDQVLGEQEDDPHSPGDLHRMAQGEGDERERVASLLAQENAELLAEYLADLVERPSEFLRQVKVGTSVLDALADQLPRLPG